MTEILTERLHLRMFRPDDFEAHALISGDPEVMRYIPPGPMTRVEAWRQMAQYVGHWQLRGYGIWAVIERSSQKLIGRIGLLNPESGNGFEVGWALAREAWGKGYALEGTRAALDYAFNVVGWQDAVAVIHPENARSIRVAERLGGTFERNRELSGVPASIYCIKRPGSPGTPGAGAGVEAELRNVVAAATPRLLAITEAQASLAPAPGKWSPKQVIGHLIDSASNNHQRFVRAQFQADLVFPGYEQEAWVNAQNYQAAPWTELVSLWQRLNFQLARVITAIPASVRNEPRARHNFDDIAWRPVPRSEASTLEYFLLDYVGHLKHHLSQALARAD